MLPDVTLPVSLSALLAAFGPCFTVPTFRTFCALACGFLGQTGKRTVCGMLTGAGLSRTWPHDRAHSFFSRARWDPDDLGLAAARLVVALLVPAGQPVTVAIDDTLFRRRGKKVWAAAWFHDGAAPGPHKTGRGNNWVVAAIVVTLPFLDRPVALPVLAKLVVKGTTSASRLWRASHSREAEVVPLTTSFASTGRATGRSRNGSVTTMAATTQLLPRPVLCGPGAAPSWNQAAAQTFLPRRRNSVSSMATVTGCPAGTSSATTRRAAARPRSSGSQRALEKKERARSCGQVRDKPAPVSMPHTVRLPVCPRNPQASAQNVRNVGTVKHGPNAASSADSETGRVTSGSIGGIPFTWRSHKHRRCSLLHPAS